MSGDAIDPITAERTEAERDPLASREDRRLARQEVCQRWSRQDGDTAMTEYKGSFALRGPEDLWLPGIPLPLYGIRKRCGCGRAFWTMSGYRAHYALAHILEVSA